MDPKKLKDLIGEDDLGLLDVKQTRSSVTTGDQRIIASFKEIVDFTSKKNKVPAANKDDIEEYKLYSRLRQLKDDPYKVKLLKEYDMGGLLTDQPKIVESMKDVFNDLDWSLFEDKDEVDLHTLKHVKATFEMPDDVAQRKPCKDFKDFEKIFLDCHNDLKTKKRELYPFSKEQQIKQGHFFILKGIMVYVADVGEKTNTNGKINARLRCIFDNGTESNMLLRSLARELYKDGRRVLEPSDTALEAFENITDEDKHSGFIYILSSLSKKEPIPGVRNMFKIGFSTTSVEERIRNCEKESTYLYGPVKIISAYKCFNMNSQKLENLIHTFFRYVRVEFEVTDPTGNLYRPKEWFVAPIEVIEQAVLLIINGEIVNYRYDVNKQEIILR